MLVMQFDKAVVIDHKEFAITQNEVDHSLIAADSLIDSPVLLGSEGIKVHIKRLGLLNLMNSGGLQQRCNLVFRFPV